MAAADIVIKGAREHNLRDVSLALPRNRLICLTGVSGSGKSSLAFDTLYAEGQRRYVESLSTFARQFLGQMPKPDVDHISGLSPSISIAQKTSGQNPRSTVGTVTEIYDYLRVLFARVGQGHCPTCDRPITAQSRERIVQQIAALPDGTRLMLLAPLVRRQKGEYRDLFADLLKQGFVRARVDGRVVSLSDNLQLDRQMRHDIEVVIDRLVLGPQSRARLAEAVETALQFGEGNLIVSLASDTPPGSAPGAAAAEAEPATSGNGRPKRAARSKLPRGAVPGTTVPRDAVPRDAAPPSAESAAAELAIAESAADGPTPSLPADRDWQLSAHYACTHCGQSFEPPSPQLFSFNSPQGMCRECDGLGEIYGFDPERLIADPTHSFKQGCFELIGPWRELGRWRRHIYQGVADTIEYQQGLSEGTLLNTPWQDLDPALQRLWLWGTGDLHITYTWRQGALGQKYGGRFEGIIPALLSKYRGSRSGMQRRMLEKYMRVIDCGACGGKRLNPQARAVRITTARPRFAERPARTLPEVCALSVAEAADFFAELRLSETDQRIAAELLKEVRGRLGFLLNVGLDYLSLDRPAPTLSGGESQRIRLAGQIGSGLVGVLYILDEPSIGLHPRDNDRLIETLTQLRDMGNTVVVVEHDEATMRAADHVVDFGPGPGVRGGHVVASGPVSSICRAKQSLTGRYLSGRESIAVPARRRPIGEAKLEILGATHNNLREIDVAIPLGAMVCVTGVSGSGKSSLVGDILVEALRRDLNGGQGDPGKHRAIAGLEQLDKMIAIDQSPIGRTPRSNPATYIKVFDDIRRLYTQLPAARTRGYPPGRFSFNVSGGRCEACEGNGSNRLEMDFLADIWVTCPVCSGHRFNRETLQIQFKGKSIADVLEMDVQQALTHFSEITPIAHKLQTLHDVGLDYLKLGQPSPTLSGGEAQRIKLARELVKKSTGRTLYLLDEPTTGLHFADIKLLLEVLHGFVDAGNTVLVVEHNLDVIKTADWIIDLGPEGGAGGGSLVACGTPEEVAATAESHTGRALAELLSAGAISGASPSVGTNGRALAKARALEKRRAAKQGGDGPARPPRVEPITEIRVQGARQHNLKGLDVRIPRDQMTVCCGLSGSGKSSLAMDTIYAEGQRRYVESLSAYARQFVSQMQKPDIDHISGLSPAIAIEQKNMGHTPRSTVGTVTEVYDYLRVLFARLGTQFCPACDVAIGSQTADQIVDKVLAREAGTRLYLMAPLELQVGERYEALWDEIRGAGYQRMRVDGQTYAVDEPPTIDRRRKHRVEVLVDRVVVRPESRSRIADSVESALSLGRGVLHVTAPNEQLPEPRWPVEVHSQHYACDRCGRSFEPLSPHHFSFNSALGWCPACEGLGTQWGANPAALVPEPRRTLLEGAVALWPTADGELAGAMLASLATGTGLPLDVPFEQRSARHRRLVLHGTGDEWFEVEWPARRGGGASTARTAAARAARAATSAASAESQRFRFQYKGVYPALEEAARLSPALRARLEHLDDEVDCSTCGGSRLRDDSAAVRWTERTIDELARLPLGQLLAHFRQWQPTARERKIAGEVVREIEHRLEFLVDVGLDYLSLARPAPTLSGGEAQRIRLASQVGSGLTGVLYVLDEPTIGLHPRDNRRLLDALVKLRDLGNTLLLVEHDREVIAAADQLLDFGPAAGEFGGEIVAHGPPAKVARQRASVTGPYISGKKAIAVPTNRRPVSGSEAAAASGSTAGAANSGAANARSRTASAASRRAKPSAAAAAATGTSASRGVRAAALAQRTRPASAATARAASHPDGGSGDGGGWLEIVGARHNNLQNIDVRIPLGTLTAVTGVSGSGKSSLVDDVLYASLARYLHNARTVPGAHEALRGVEQINKVIRVDQQPLGNTPTSNPATYTGVFELIRELFAQLPEARLRGYTPRRFSFNVPGGRCETCEGNGQIRVEMHFLPDVWVRCDDCQGQRYNAETLAVRYRGHTIADLLEMPCGRAVELLGNLPKIRRTLQMLCDVGLDYVKLGQPAPTLSGGEAQRVKLAAELARPDTGQTLYLLDEPTTGLHFDDLARLLDVLNRLVDLGNTVVVIEHNLDVIKTADWVIDLGPEAGQAGGRLVACGTPEDVAAYAAQAAQQAAESGHAEPGDAKPGDEKPGGRSKRRAAKSSPAAARSARRNGQRHTGSEAPSRSHTGELLGDVLRAGPHAPRPRYDFAAELARREGDMQIAEVGRETHMPWQVDGRRWHTRDRVSRAGQPCRWDGAILARVVDFIEQQGTFKATNWEHRSVVEIAGPSATDGWFLHALTGDEWLLTLKFRATRSTFDRQELIASLDLKPLNEMPDLPVYGHEPRVKVRTLRGPWQEVQLRVHALAEIDRPPFWEFVRRAAAGFGKLVERKRQSPDDLMPWKVLGRKWHFSRKGFPPGKPAAWPVDLLEQLCETLQQAAPDVDFLWNNQQVVNMFVEGQSEAWATLFTKRREAVDLMLTGPKGHVSLGRVAQLGFDPQLRTAPRDKLQLRLRFRRPEDLDAELLLGVLRESLGTIRVGKP